jgi:hypothetical protein
LRKSAGKFRYIKNQKSKVKNYIRNGVEMERKRRKREKGGRERRLKDRKSGKE